MGGRLMTALREAEGLAAVAEVRGVGLMAGVELEEPADGAELAGRIRRRGAIVRATGQKLVLSPPLVIEPEQIDRLAEIIVSELAATTVPA
jgi:beta-alanine--pyruvate transaminase